MVEELFAKEYMIIKYITVIWASLVAQMVKNPPAMGETWF